MSQIEWEYDLAEKPFCEQLKGMGWQWIEGDPDLPETTDRTTSREVLLKGRLSAALKKLNLRNGQPWPDDNRIAHAIRDLEQAGGHRLVEVNQSATKLLLKGTVPMVCRIGIKAGLSRFSSLIFRIRKRTIFSLLTSSRLSSPAGAGMLFPMLYCL